jgi:hypothetical protein
VADPANFECIVISDGVERVQPYTPAIGYLITWMERVRVSHRGHLVLELFNQRQQATKKGKGILDEVEHTINKMAALKQEASEETEKSNEE